MISEQKQLIRLTGNFIYRGRKISIFIKILDQEIPGVLFSLKNQVEKLFGSNQNQRMKKLLECSFINKYFLLVKDRPWGYNLHGR